MLRLRAVATRPALGLVVLLLASAGCASESRRPGPVDVTIAEPPRADGPLKIRAAVAPRRSAAPSEPIEPCIAKLRSDPAPGASADPAADLYRRALASEKANERDVARKSYFEIVDKHKGSALIPASYFAFAEMFRAESKENPDKVDFAKMAYEEVVKYPPPGNSLYQVARLRVGELQALAGNHQESVSSFAAVITGDAGGTCGGAAVAAAFDAIIPVFAKMGDPKKAPVFLGTLRPRGSIADPEHTAELTLRLAQLYLDAKQPADAAAVLRALASGTATDTLCTSGHRLAVHTGDAAAEAAIAARCSPR